MENVKGFVNYADRKYIEGINRHAWGEIYYTKRLPHPEDYDLEEDTWSEL